MKVLETKARYFVSIFSLVVTIFIFNSTPTFAATLSFSPLSGTYKLGSNITVSILVSTPDKTMNAASGQIFFPSDLLSVASISKSSSIVNFWAQEPSYSNTAGTVNFEGVLLPPGFTGSSGKIISITFKTKSPGTANLTFNSDSSKTSVLEADGSGTNILTSTGSAFFDITNGQVPEPTVSTGVPSVPSITSSTHPDQNTWYPRNDASFSWNLPKDVTKSSVLIDRDAQSSPTVAYAPPTSSKDAKSLEEGTWYIHVQLKNSIGWGKVSNFRFQIDTEKPTYFNITEVKRDDLTNPKAKFTFDSSDKTSGIDHYEIQTDNGSAEIWRDDGSHQYTTILLSPGKHSISARAVDKSGNFLTASAEFSVEGLNPPSITDYPKKLTSGQTFIVKGSSYSNSRVTLVLQKGKDEPKNISIDTDQNGNFTYSAEKLEDGVYKMYAEAVNISGAKSVPSPIYTTVIAKSFISGIFVYIKEFISRVIPILLIIILVIIALWYIRRKFFMLKKKTKREVHGVEFIIHKAFESLKSDVREQIKMLEKARTKRQLTDEEEKIIRQLRKDLDDAERFIRNEIGNMESRLK